MTSLEKLILHFEQFPGIGPRQAKRFTNHLLTKKPEDIDELSKLIANIQTSVVTCHSCYRFYPKNGNGDMCQICDSIARDNTKIAVVESDSDMLTIEQSGVYDGMYFVLGGMVPLLDSKDNNKVRGGSLKHIIEQKIANGLNEIILAFSINPDGENTGRYVKKLLSELIEKNNISITTLGQGLSTGSELEYADSETIKNAMNNRG